MVSYLPDAHAANRWFAHYPSLTEGAQITTEPELGRVFEALTEVHPTIFLGVPRIWVKVEAALEQRLEAERFAIPSPIGWRACTSSPAWTRLARPTR